MTAVFIYVTASSVLEAKAIANAIVTDRLAACANIFPGVTTVYHDDGQLCEGQEAIIIFKTRDTFFPAVEERVKELHSYKTPCIVALPTMAAHAPYIDWLMAETKP